MLCAPDHRRLADRAFVDQATHLVVASAIVHLHAEREQAAASFSRVNHAVRLLERDSHRLLAQHVNVPLQRRQRHVHVQIVGHGHVHPLDIAAIEQLFVILEGLRRCAEQPFVFCDR